MMNISRRSFIQGTSALLGMGLLPKMVMAQSTGGLGRNLVFINLKGGADGLSLCPYYEGVPCQVLQVLRPTIHIPANTALKPFAQTGSAIKVGLHPAFFKASQAAGAGCAIVQKYGILQDPGRSHDTCQLLYSIGANGGASANAQGFLARLMDLQRWESFQLWGIQAESGPEFDTNHNPPILLSSLDSLEAARTYSEDGFDQALATEMLDRLVAADVSEGRLQKLYQSSNRILKNTLKSVKADILSQLVGNNAYGDYAGWEVGSSLKDAARILKAKAAGNGVLQNDLSTILYLNNGGYDTHSDQANPDTDNLSTNLQSLGDNLAVFIQDLKNAQIWEKTTIILFSEFGRTTRENGATGDVTVGTDHGWGSNTVLLGGSIRGGVYGDAPDGEELANADTNALIPTTDYRDIFSDALEWLSVDPESVFTAADYTRNKIGLLG